MDSLGSRAQEVDVVDEELSSEHRSSGRPTVPQRHSVARERILDTADRLFYTTGIRAVGVDRVIAESQVARMTFFRHFPTKDDLVATFLRRRVDRARGELARVEAEHPGEPRAVLAFFAAGVSSEPKTPGFRGCEFINTAAEFCDPTHPARGIAAEHRAWITSKMRDALTELGHPTPGTTAEALLMLRTGAMVASSLEGITTDDETFQHTWWSLVG
jgi:AcrR family transcriptional regulator